MIRSMTAYGRAKEESEKQTVVVEIRSVNSRFFDCSVRLPKAYSFLEEKIKSYLQSNVISRGKIEVNLQYEPHGEKAKSVHVDHEYAKQYVLALQDLKETYGLQDEVSLSLVAENPNVFTMEAIEESPDDVWNILYPTLSSAANDYSSMRIREGEKTKEDIFSKLQNVMVWASQIEEISKTDIVGYREKLEARLKTILQDHSIEIDENRILTECAIWADKIAIDEELARLKSHFSSFEEIVKEPTPSGKKLDFLMQEFNRETNTIGSKCNNANIAKIVVNIKNELEKIREQIQNIE